MARWSIHPTENAVLWTPGPDERHVDDYEMAGYRCAFVVTYGTDENGFVAKGLGWVFVDSVRTTLTPPISWTSLRKNGPLPL